MPNEKEADAERRTNLETLLRSTDMVYGVRGSTQSTRHYVRLFVLDKGDLREITLWVGRALKLRMNRDRTWLTVSWSASGILSGVMERINSEFGLSLNYRDEF